MEEMSVLEDAELTLEVSFYGENAQDEGGPRREFFRLCLQEIKSKYFDNGLKEHLFEDYEIVGLIMGLSVLQGGKMPRFLTEDQLQDVFMNDMPTSQCLTYLAKGFAKLGLRKITRSIFRIPLFVPTYNCSSTHTPTASLSFETQFFR